MACTVRCILIAIIRLYFQNSFKNRIPTTLWTISMGLRKCRFTNNKAIEMFNWEKLFQNKNIHDQLKLFNETIVNIVSNYIPNKFITCNEKDLPWLNDHIKRLINLKNEIFIKYLTNRRPDSVYKNLQTITWDLAEAVSSSKNVYYEQLSNKLNDPNTSTKAYWSISKTLFNDKKFQLHPQY